MPIYARRIIYSLFAALGFLMIVPLMVSSRRLGAQIQRGGIDVQTGIDFSVIPGYEWQSLLAIVGLSLAAGFLYAALSTGHPRAWRPQENGAPRCNRCGAEVPFAVRRCPSCDQHLIW
jgi:hypothetical protein